MEHKYKQKDSYLSPRYKAGDRVVIRIDLLSYKVYEKYRPSKTYAWFKPGNIVTIDYYNRKYNFYVAEGDEFLTDKMIDHVLTKKHQKNIKDINTFKDLMDKPTIHPVSLEPQIISDKDIEEIIKDKSVSLNTLKILEY